MQIYLFPPLLLAQSVAHHGSSSGDLNFTSHRINMRFYFQRNNKETSNVETQDMLIRQYDSQVATKPLLHNSRAEG